ncbi:MAG: hypothetical protein F4Y00_07050 [Bacteroidetes bacterium SB0662_bin_6]|nr:hypothetical protein [Bacteroidetes bacterium SB0668_bin_1]MYE04709.1 hypothetical protein [Bacteroidetes bacterium SB0662_bin_6]
MTSLSLYFKGWLLALPILILAAGTAAAQQPDSLRGDDPTLRSFNIQDGVVSINGRQIPPEKLPEDFPPKGASVNYTMSSSDENLIIQLQDGRRYTLEGDSLWLKTHMGDFECILLDGACADMEADATLFIVTAPPEAILARKADDLREQARRLQDLQHRFDESQTNELQQMLEEMTMHAAEAARTASEFPHIQMQHYLSDIQDNDRGLFDRLMSERRMEHETVNMARKLAAMEEGKARRDSIAVLRERLTEIFELKQENRRREVEQLEEKLQELQKAVSERERLGDQIVDRRLQELLGNDTLDW